MKTRRPVFYPILPSSPRKKGPRTVNDGSTNTPYGYLRRKYARYITVSTNSVIVTSNETQTWTFGNVSQSVVKRPDWKQIIAKGTNATNPYSRIIATVKPVTYRGTSSSPPLNMKGDGFGLYHGNSLIQPQSWAPLQSAAIGRLKNKLNGYIGNAQLMAPIAESREIHRIVRQINNLGIDAVKALLAVKKSQGKSAAKFFGDVWLGFGFGINPMLKDIEKAANSILDYTTREDRHVRVVGAASVEFLTNGKLFIDCFPGAQLHVSSYGSHKQGVRYVAGIDLKLRSGASYSVTDHLGLKISDLPATLWELTPYSWVVDYFATVSPWLEDMFFTLPGTTKYISENTKYQLETKWVPEIKPYDSSYSASGSGSSGVHRYVSFTRNSLASLPSRPLRLKTLDEVAQHSLTKFLNLASVLAGRRGPKL